MDNQEKGSDTRYKFKTEKRVENQSFKTLKWVVVVVSILIVVLFSIFLKFVLSHDQSSEKRRDHYEIPKEDGRVTREESDAHKEKVITSQIHYIDHSGLDTVPWEMLDGNNVLRPVKTSFAAKEYEVAGYRLTGNGFAVEVWSKKGGDRKAIDTPRCDFMIFRLTENTEEDSVALFAEPDMTFSLDRRSQRTITLERFQRPDESEEVAETNTEPTEDEDVPQKADKPSKVW